MTEAYAGRVVHFFPKIGVAVITLVEQLEVGDIVHFKTPQKKRRAIQVDFEQEVTSLQIEHQLIELAKPGRMVAIKVNQKVRPGDDVYKKVE